MTSEVLHNRVKALKEFLFGYNIVPVQEREIQSGYQIQLFDENGKLTINIYSTGRIILQGKQTSLKDALQNWVDGISVMSSTEPSHSATTNTAKFLVQEAEFETIKHLLLESSDSAQIIEQDTLGSQQVFRIELRQAHEKVVITQYKTGTLLVQGKLGSLFENVCQLLEGLVPQSFIEKSVRYIPDDKRDFVAREMSHPKVEADALSWATKQLDGQAILSFLSVNDKKTYLSGVGLLLTVERFNIALEDFSALVMPFARVFEGFLIQLAIALKVADAQKLETDPGGARISDYLDEIRRQITSNDKRYNSIHERLDSVWKDIRNKLFHSDLYGPQRYSSFIIAQNDIYTINNAICQAYNFLTKSGVLISSEPPTL
jgi:hypothetical protein